MGAPGVLESAFKCWVSLGKSFYHLGLSFPIEKMEQFSLLEVCYDWVCIESNR